MLTASAIALALASSSFDRPTHPGPDTTRCTVLIASRPAGSQVSWAEADGTLRYTFEFNDRGRGPKVSERVVLGRDGLPVLVEVSGNDYLKNAVDERFARRGRRAAWRSSSEADSSTAPGFYTSVDGVPEETAVLARALRKAPGGRLEMLPGGEARIEKVGELTLRGATDSTVASYYAIHGLGLSPTPIWLDPDGRFFAQGGGAWFMVIRKGFETSVPALLEAQDKYATRRGTDLAARLARRPAGPVAFRDANLFDPTSGKSLPHTTVVVQG